MILVHKNNLYTVLKNKILTIQITKASTAIQFKNLR
jgi:hypothetical protein